ncbi:uncharacterized protein A4U43_C07F38160 [Asparagus officinalis]|uniref:Uncharacterized protein n=1 Tax=Asparagus officinalis TaxID=4686 RepID=A0A5P1ELW2_ASPOF|nr:uncharacterized protein A4U43_C07F38160 [Asparagus officinalis]
MISSVEYALRLRRWRKGSSEAGNEFLWQPVYLPDLDIPIRRIYYQKFVLGEDQRGGGGQILPFWAPEACVLAHAAGSAISECLFEMMGRVMGNAWEPKLDYEIRCF